MDPSPKHELPRSTVPQAAQQHYDHQVDSRAEGAAPISTERNVQVVA